MSKAERGESTNITEKANGSLRQRRNRISRWLITRGFSSAALGTLGIAGYLAIFGGVVAAAITAPLFVSVAGAVAVVGGSLAVAGVGKRTIDSLRV